MDLTKEKCKCAPSSSKILLQNFLRSSKEISNDKRLISRKRDSCPGDSAWVPVWNSSLYLVSLVWLFSRVISIWQQDPNDELSPEWEGVNEAKLFGSIVHCTTAAFINKFTQHIKVPETICGENE